MNSYEDFSPAADKWLHMDGSVTTMAGEPVLPADSERAALYETMSPNVAKWLLPDGSIVSDLLCSGGDGTDGVEKRPTLYNAECMTSGGYRTKELTGLPDGYKPQKGDIIMVKFLVTNTVDTNSFQLAGGTTTYTILFNGYTTNLVTSSWIRDSVFPFYFDGKYFHQLNYGRYYDSDAVFNQPLGDFYIAVNSERPISAGQLVMERTDNTFDKALISNASTGTERQVNTSTDFKVDGLICYYSGANQVYNSAKCNDDFWIQYNTGLRLQSAFNGQNHLESYRWVYLVGIPQEDPMVYRLNPASYTSWYTTGEPTTEDGKVYIPATRIAA